MISLFNREDFMVNFFRDIRGRSNLVMLNKIFFKNPLARAMGFWYTMSSFARKGERLIFEIWIVGN